MSGEVTVRCDVGPDYGGDARQDAVSPPPGFGVLEWVLKIVHWGSSFSSRRSGGGFWFREIDGDVATEEKLVCHVGERGLSWRREPTGTDLEEGLGRTLGSREKSDLLGSSSFIVRALGVRNFRSCEFTAFSEVPR
ncbi:hypothetical protein H6P81_019286 [Aristolochia fimbriata]|uniref:Uncharacterized protein n=1 Tax=Aristolochia fimbriata TaxID=158543 RepID=A0AAV7DUB1_ARIFI|nr:hypothetical protein H6P81_019286 [Aristolochia fimbriata]